MTEKINKQTRKTERKTQITITYIVSQVLKGVAIASAASHDQVSILDFDSPKEYAEKYGKSLSQHLSECIELMERIKRMRNIQYNVLECSVEVVDGIKEDDDKLLKVAKIVYEYRKLEKTNKGNYLLRKAMEAVNAKGKLGENHKIGKITSFPHFGISMYIKQ